MFANVKLWEKAFSQNFDCFLRIRRTGASEVPERPLIPCDPRAVESFQKEPGGGHVEDASMAHRRLPLPSALYPWSASGSGSASGFVVCFCLCLRLSRHPRPSCAPAARPRCTARGDSPTPHVSRWPHGPGDRRPAWFLEAQGRQAFPWVARLDVSPRLENGPGAKRRARHAPMRRDISHSPFDSVFRFMSSDGANARSWLSPGRGAGVQVSSTKCRSHLREGEVGDERRPPSPNRRRCASGGAYLYHFYRRLLPSLREPSLPRGQPDPRCF